MKKYIFLILTLCFTTNIHADEGMWLVHLLEQNLKNMQSYGFKLTAKEVYNENNPSLHDAVVALDFGCTGSMISEQGLMITNHHCAYDDIHQNSTSENNILENGFWAKNRSEEIPIKGKSVFFLRRVIDVTDEMNAYLDSCKNAGSPVGTMGMRRVTGNFEKKYSEGTTYEAMCHNVYRGVKWYVFLYDQFKDVRLVGAPPVSIGAFGGEADNFKWPQHKGDFALYRVYGDKNGKPAEYSSENVPIKAKKTLTISEKGIRDNDFSMMLGYPFSTYRYIPSVGLNEKIEALNPAQHYVKRSILDAMRVWMDADTTVRLKYASKYFSIANSQELRKGEW
ncbi:MAG: S46 family peptidase, partial [Bacteroidales bacterium]|nr:S46 family peptidase [Bacteroidales bacterium]